MSARPSLSRYPTSQVESPTKGAREQDFPPRHVVGGLNLINGIDHRPRTPPVPFNLPESNRLGGVLPFWNFKGSKGV